MEKNHFAGNAGEHVAWAMWRRLDTPGHDAALLVRSGTGHLLTGTAIFLHADGPARIDYRVRVDCDWNTTDGHIAGFVAGRTVRHEIVRDSDGWRLDGLKMPDVASLRDLDLGFTPATNLLQLRRAGPEPGRSAELTVAWFDIGETRITALPQFYDRKSETTYEYSAPSVPYEAVLEMAPNGFVQSYPGLWMMEV
ncbi:putative glycolipid-binding domain-containing protein [Nitratireductor sp. ZSWI3]|uniref:putative glycolipid-binding domain-containing protein n=1 Tax=Nitratireductor sp. ZSWI3 TaxID=2966359 RepID=UPI002150329C|nr:putative glycolipid-binding domain-containing protein [Nitratireductor sp. ZSWI3]MCR4265472.1 putative glycolipid-binding domain-containing protein [Nitratireductor sp. ZSWI3]